MIKQIKYTFIIVGLFTLFFPVKLFAQIDDIGAWFGGTVQKKFTRQLEGSIGSQLRLKNDLTNINQFLVDVGVDYSLTKKLKAGFHYRYIKSNQDNYYSSRHRLYVDLAWKEKINFISITLRERIQEQYSDINSSETGKIPLWVLRSKISVKFDLEKKYSPYLSGEMYYLLDSPKEIEYISRYRLETGIDYNFNRLHSINPFILYQVSTSPHFVDLIYGIMYTASF